MKPYRLGRALQELGDTTFCFWAVWTVNESAPEPKLDYYIYAETFEEASQIVERWLDSIGAGENVVKIEKLSHLIDVDVLFDADRMVME